MSEQWLEIHLSLGDPHHNPYQEDPVGTTKRVQTALDLIKKFGCPKKVYSYWDEDCLLFTPISKESFEAFGKDASLEKDGDSYYWEMDVIGQYRLWGRIEDDPQVHCFKLQELTGTIHSASDILRQVLPDEDFGVNTIDTGAIWRNAQRAEDVKVVEPLLRKWLDTHQDEFDRRGRCQCQLCEQTRTLLKEWNVGKK